MEKNKFNGYLKDWNQIIDKLSVLDNLCRLRIILRYRIPLNVFHHQFKIFRETNL